MSSTKSDIQPVSNESPIRTVLVGCGEHARVVIHAALSLIEDIEVVAACDLDQERARDASRRFGNCPHYSDLEVMLSETDAQAAVIVGPPHVHTSIAVTCLQAGLHIFVEKPLFTSLEDLNRISVLAAEKPGLNISVSFNKRYAPYICQTREILNSDSFGMPSYLYAKFAGGYRNGSTDLLRVGAIHYFDLARHLFGDITRVSALPYEKQAGQAHIAVNLQFASGAIGNFFLSSLGLWSAKGAEYLEIRGDRNFITLDNLRELTWQKPPLSIRNSGSSHQAGIELPAPAEYLEPNYSNISLLEYQSNYQNGYFTRIKTFVTDLRSGQQSGPGLKDAEHAFKTALAIEESIAANGTYVEL
ncbi:Myo-inositol 2-dehydrogenase [Sulfitobacter sp. DSM 110093]|uniref:Gfo/Idh/MocA family oxidoreductase n=1 Tax=Sulfitobacter sp. DSM 110093 TaxID=2883127 RepID=UPI001FADF5F1|nr:Gfo/Idh/MocA family oxidoreductase [Sulfitobacter sp. DSM 110093]UOA32842.1 Myo-inositol 2-dehydrogenase [Sulfitobacter sp. DSM 110093]